MRTVFLLVAFCIRVAGYAQPQCPAPYAQFTYTIGSDGFTVIFKVDDCDPDYIYNWSFGDGTSYYQTDSQADPTHIYSDDGIYLVTMTISLPAPCTATYTQTAEITINHSSPSSMWLDLSGPSLAGKCQQVTFNAQVTGGVPPYIYTWNMGDADCPSCAANCSSRDDFEGIANETATFTATGFFPNSVCVTVTDANGNSEYKCLEIKVKDFEYPLEMNITGTKNSNGNCYLPNSNIIFTPDIDPYLLLNILLIIPGNLTTALFIWTT
ncbi:MAG: PKD domain-containing protein [Lewinellaceae bacterium]|nr:PKD domain-containing protein [Lewinellaceae bacterium]